MQSHDASHIQQFQTEGSDFIVIRVTCLEISMSFDEKLPRLASRSMFGSWGKSEYIRPLITKLLLPVLAILCHLSITPLQDFPSLDIINMQYTVIEHTPELEIPPWRPETTFPRIVSPDLPGTTRPGYPNHALPRAAQNIAGYFSYRNRSAWISKLNLLIIFHETKRKFRSTVLERDLSWGGTV